jgi:hypothetical protein
MAGIDMQPSGFRLRFDYLLWSLSGDHPGVL